MSTTPTGATHLARVLLDPIIATLCNRGELSPAQREAKARDLWSVVATCEPQDAIQTMLIGQCLLFNELVADGGRDVLISTMDSPKPRAQSNVNALSRSLHQSIKTFLRLRDKSSAAVAPADDVRETMAAAQRGVDSLSVAPVLNAATEPSHQDSRQPRESGRSETPAETPAVSPAQSIANETRTAPDMRPPHPHPAIDPRHATVAARPKVESVPSRSERIPSPERAEAA